MMKPLIYLHVNSPHRAPMEKLCGWLQKQMPEYEFQIISPFLSAWKIKRNKPYAIITYNKNCYSNTTVSALIEFTQKGGRLIALHHNISSMMMRQPKWLAFAKVQIEKGEHAKYPWSVMEGGDLFLFNLSPNHPITTNNVTFPDSAPILETYGMKADASQWVLTHALTTVEMTKVSQERTQPALKFHESEYFINHVLLPAPERVLLFGEYFIFPKKGKAFISANGGWMLPVGRGKLFYFMPGHSSHDYNEEYCHIIKNALEFEDIKNKQKMKLI